MNTFCSVGVLLCLLALLIAQPFLADPNGLDLQNITAAPSFQHVLGTDQLGRDLLSRMLSSLIQTVLPLWGIVLGAIFSGLAFGVGFFGLLSERMQRITFALFKLVAGLPYPLITFLIVLIAQNISFTTVAWTVFLIYFSKAQDFLFNSYERDQHQGFWLANRSLGGSRLHRVIQYGVLSHWRKDLLNLMCIALQYSLIIEVTLSYFSLGVAEPLPSLGNLLAMHYSLILQGEYQVPLLIVGFLGFLLWVPQAIHCLLISWVYIEKAPQAQHSQPEMNKAPPRGVSGPSHFKGLKAKA